MIVNKQLIALAMALALKNKESEMTTEQNPTPAVSGHIEILRDILAQDYQPLEGEPRGYTLERAALTAAIEALAASGVNSPAMHHVDWIIKNLDEPEKAARSHYRGIAAIKHVATMLKEALATQHNQENT